MKIYCVYDSKVSAFGTPFFFKTKGEALRGFGEISNDLKTQIGKYPADFTLFEMGDYDELHGTFMIYPTPVSVAVAIELVNQDKRLNYSDPVMPLAAMQ